MRRYRKPGIRIDYQGQFPIRQNELGISPWVSLRKAPLMRNRANGAVLVVTADLCITRLSYADGVTNHIPQRRSL